MTRLSLAALAVLAACTSMSDTPDNAIPSRAITSRAFGTDAAGRPATLWTLRNGSMEVDVTDHGATLYVQDNRTDPLVGATMKVHKWVGYYKIARHYQSALNKVFAHPAKYDSVIILEDDIDIAPDFFEWAPRPPPPKHQDYPVPPQGVPHALRKKKKKNLTRLLGARGCPASPS